MFCFIFDWPFILQDELRETIELEPFLSNVEVVEKCFGMQRHNHVICFGGGVKPKDLKAPLAKKAELEEKLHQTEEENQNVKARLRTLEDEFQRLKEMFLAQQSNEEPQTSSP